ncbi:MAG: hypothetical protein GY774_11675 [Planctomycetes bacterium]|nr:hypothetical protein [Planctomycetota bacterium]
MASKNCFNRCLAACGYALGSMNYRHIASMAIFSIGVTGWYWECFGGEDSSYSWPREPKNPDSK